MTISHEELMKIAIEVAREGIKKNQSPFGAVVVDKRKKKIIAKAHNTVLMDNDATAHAEINAIRKACSALNTYDLQGCAIYSTCEPCPMCFAAIHWANIDEVYYGASIENAMKCGFREITISNAKMKEIGGIKVKVYSGILRDECVEMMREWMKNPNRKVY